MTADSNSLVVRAKQGLVIVLAALGVRHLLTEDAFGLLDSVDLAIHETGHLVFAPFGELVGMLGGTLFQLIVPFAFVAYFLRRRDRYAACIVLGWVAQNLWNIARYIADARARALPLVGGGRHDWTYLLGRLDLLPHDELIASIVRFTGICLFVASMVLAFHYAARPRRTTDPEAAEEAAQPVNPTPASQRVASSE